MDLFNIPKKQDRFNSLKAKVSLCVACPLALTRETVILGQGCIDEPVFLFIGEQPSKTDENNSKSFSDPCWDQFKNKLKTYNVLDRCFFTQQVLCRPPNDRNPTKEEVHTCAQNITELQKLLKPMRTLSHNSLDKLDDYLKEIK